MKKLLIFLIVLVPSITQADRLFETYWNYDTNLKVTEYYKKGAIASTTKDTAFVVSDLGLSQEYAVSADSTCVYSASASDSTGGAGLTILAITGILGSSDNYKLTQELVYLSGTDTVNLTQDFYWINDVRAAAAGSLGVAAGNITFEIGGRKVCRILAGYKSVNSTVFYMPGADFYGNKFNSGSLQFWFGAVIKQASAVSSFDLEGIEPGGSFWFTIDERSSHSAGSNGVEWRRSISIKPGCGARVVSNCTDNGARIVSGFQISIRR